jgi:hypothetical protein
VGRRGPATCGVPGVDVNPIGTSTPMDRQETCAVRTKQGHIAGVPCGDEHQGRVHIFDLRKRKPMSCLDPNCSVKLTRRPRTSAGISHRVYGDYVVVSEGGM